MKPSLIPFLAASLLAHGALLALYGDRLHQGWLSGEAFTVLSVDFAAAAHEPEGWLAAPRTLSTRKKARAASPPPLPPLVREPASTTALDQAIARPTSGARAPRETLADAAPSAEADSSLNTPSDSSQSAAESPRPSEANETARARIEARLRAWLERYFEYPYAARQRGWQGEVRLGFLVLPDGRLERLRVTRSSGFALLDASALDSLARIGRLEEAAHWLDGRALEMQLSVIYRLRDGS
jgi:protein TonB